MGADQFLLPHLGAQARILLDRIVASGADGVDRRDTVEWVLSRLIDLRYVEQSPLNDMVFVCTPAGRHRWQMEILADDQRDAAALRRQLIRHRLDKRFNRLGISTSTALTAYSPVEPRLHRRAPAEPRAETKVRLASVLAVLFAATAVALVVVSASAEPQDVRDWLFPPTLHAAAAPGDPPKANAEQAALVAAPVPATVPAAVDPLNEEAPGRVVVSADAASSDDRTVIYAAVTASALIGSVVQDSGQIATGLARGIEHVFRSTAAALIDSVASESGQFTTDLRTGVERGFRSSAAVLLPAIADLGRPVFAPDAVAQQAHDAVPAPVAPAAGSPSEREQPATRQPAIAPRTASDRAAIVPVTPDERAIAKAPTARAGEARLDPQHSVVERLNLLSLAAARQGQVWRPNSPVDVAETGRPR